MSATPARRAALEVMRRVRRGGLADRALARLLPGLPELDRAWAQELVYGTLRLRGRLDHILAAHVTRGLDGLQAETLDVLRLGVYQLLEMDGVPPYAAVSESVELAKARAGPGAAGLVNAVLKAVQRADAERLFPKFEEDAVGHLATRGSHPMWLVERWVSQFGAAPARRLVDRNNARPPTYLRPVGMDVEAAAAGLHAVGIDAQRVPSAPSSLLLEAAADVKAALAAVPAVVQDPAASLVARYVTPPEGAYVADLCSAPGGKALVLAGDGAVARVIAADVSSSRQRMLWENAARIQSQLGSALPLDIIVADARSPAVGRADTVFLDVPCTGTGTLRRHPDGRWRVGPEGLASLVALQREMLDAAAALVPVGSMLVYATCSLEREENEDQVEAFLERTPAYELMPPPDSVDSAFLDAAGHLAVRPQDHDMDGAFAARLSRKD